MKRIISVLTILLLLVGCTKNETIEKVSYTNDVVIDVENVDMSAYNEMSFSDHNYVGVQMNQIIKMINEGGTALVFLGYPGCFACNLTVPVLDQAAEDKGVEILYVKGDNIPNEDFYGFIDLVEDHLQEGQDGEKTVMTPFIFALKDGKIVSEQTGLPFDYQGGSLTKSQTDKMLDIFYDIIDELKD